MGPMHACLGTHMKVWADCYAFQYESKGGGGMGRPKKLIVTSNYDIHDIWGEDEVMCEAITRRFEVIELTLENRDMVLHKIEENNEVTNETYTLHMHKGVPGNTRLEPDDFQSIPLEDQEIDDDITTYSSRG